ncbi:MAG: DUF504 domain-containing protein [Desulfurococcales archaeon]|nr:DUF504 domain-containing protein [Desulfurococcales archaeon]
MGRSILYDRLRWLLHERPNGIVIGYVHREKDVSGSIVKEIPLERVVSADKWALTLDDEWTVIPLHRIVYIKDSEGRFIYEKGMKEA